MSTRLVDEAISIYGKERGAIIPILQHIQSYSQYLDRETLIEVATELDVAPTKVYSVASFYHYLHTEPVGKFRIYICNTISCHMQGGKNILTKLSELLRIKCDEMTEDGLFSIHRTNCLGQCDRAPAMMINDIPFTGLTEDKVQYVLDDFRQHDGTNAIASELKS